MSARLDWPAWSTNEASPVVPAPPWHFSSAVLAVDFRTRPELVAPLLVPGVEPEGDGSASLVVGAWSAAADAEPALAREPALGQYHEAYVVVYGRHQGRRVGCVPHIWVDSDLAIARGNLQGFNKVRGTVALSRAVAVGSGGPRRETGATFAASVSRIGRLLITARVTLSAAASESTPRGVTTPLFLRRRTPDLTDTSATVIDDVVCNELAGFQLTQVWRGTAELELHLSDLDDVARLGPVEVTGGWTASLGYTLVGSRRVALTS